MKRGFKAEARRMAKEVRLELGVGTASAFDPYHLAKEYGVDVVRLSDLDCDVASEYFATAGFRSLSGMHIRIGQYGSLIVDNDAHPAARRRSTICHEMAHVICEHEHCDRLLDTDGCRASDPSLEEEANFLAGELLLPTDVARRLCVRQVHEREVAETFGTGARLGDI